MKTVDYTLIELLTTKIQEEDLFVQTRTDSCMIFAYGPKDNVLRMIVKAAKEDTYFAVAPVIKEENKRRTVGVLTEEVTIGMGETRTEEGIICRRRGKQKPMCVLVIKPVIILQSKKITSLIKELYFRNFGFIDLEEMKSVPGAVEARVFKEIMINFTEFDSLFVCDRQKILSKTKDEDLSLRHYMVFQTEGLQEKFSVPLNPLFLDSKEIKSLVKRTQNLKASRESMIALGMTCTLIFASLHVVSSFFNSFLGEEVGISERLKQNILPLFLTGIVLMFKFGFFERSYEGQKYKDARQEIENRRREQYTQRE